MKITVMGLGYIGLPTAITLAEAGFEVCGFDVNKKVRRLAMKSALSAKVAAEEMIVLDSFGVDAIKTKEVAEVLAAIKAGKKTLIVLPEKNDIVYKSARNIAGTNVTLVNTLNVYDILNCNTIVVLKDAVAKIEEVYE